MSNERDKEARGTEYYQPDNTMYFIDGYSWTYFEYPNYSRELGLRSSILAEKKVKLLNQLSAYDKAVQTDVAGRLPTDISKALIKDNPGLSASLLQLHYLSHVGSAGRLRKWIEEYKNLDEVDAIDVLVNIPDVKGLTPLHRACVNKDVRVFDILIKLGADPCLVDKLQKTPLHYAAKYGQLDIVEQLLLISEVGINAKDKSHYTPLHCAAMSNHGHIVGFLLNHGADIAAKSERFLGRFFGKTARELVSDPDIKHMLKDCEREQLEAKVLADTLKRETRARAKARPLRRNPAAFLPGPSLSIQDPPPPIPRSDVFPPIAIAFR